LKVALLAPGYPSTRSPRDYAFVHARGKLYVAAGHAVRAFTAGDSTVELVEDVEGVEVERPTWRALPRRIQAWRPDVVAVHAPYFRIIDVAEAIDLPQVAWIHGHEALWSTRSHEWEHGWSSRVARFTKVPMRNAYQWWRLRRYLRRVGAVVFVSRWMQRSAEGFVRQRLSQAQIVPNPVDTAAFQYAFQASRLRAGVSVRSLENSKYGIDIAIKAFQGPIDAHLTIVGTGRLAAEYRALARRVGANVTFIETPVRHGDMPTLLSEYGFFVAPSRVEAQGVAMCEAMAVGLPVVGTQVGGIPEFVTHGQQGLLVPPESPSALREAVLSLTGDPERAMSMSKLARGRMVQECSRERVTDRELALLEQQARKWGSLQTTPETAPFSPSDGTSPQR